MARPALLVSVCVRALTAAAALLALGAVLVSCEDVEEVGPVRTASITPASPIATTTAPPTSIGMPSPSVIPADWPTYTDPGGLFTVRYPPTWFQDDAAFYSADPRTFDPLRVQLIPNIVKVEVSHYEAKRSTDCGGLSVDPATGEGTPREGVKPTTLGGVEAWELVREAGDPVIEGGLTRIQGIAAIHNGYCFLVTAYFTQQSPDIATYLQIVSSYRFLDVK